MSKAKQNQSGESIISHQKATDKAINERIKEEQGDGKISPDVANNSKNRSRKSDAGQKKAGGGKQKNAGM